MAATHPLPFRKPAAARDTELYDIPTVAARLHLSQPTIYRLIKRGSLRAVMVVGKKRIRPSDLEHFIARLTGPGGACEGHTPGHQR